VPDEIRGEADPLAFAVALIWLVHPLQTEVIGYVTQRSESTAGLFYLLTLYTAIRAMEEPSRMHRWTAASVLACASGMASKETMVTAPVAVLVYDLVFRAGSLSKALRDRAPLYEASRSHGRCSCGSSPAVRVAQRRLFFWRLALDMPCSASRR
jgi:hypothetical protein